MRVEPTVLPEVLLVVPDRHGDERGWFLETWSEHRYAGHGIPAKFVQDNLSHSMQGVLRGLHFQHPFDQGKLVHVVHGEVFDVAVDVRVGSPRFGKWVGAVLSAANHQQLWIPPGFAHGFCVLSETALFVYKCTESYHPAAERGIVWNDPELAIAWPLQSPRVSPKDAGFGPLRALDPGLLPLYLPSAL